jgi:hypothetical protein
MSLEEPGPESTVGFKKLRKVKISEFQSGVRPEVWKLPVERPDRAVALRIIQ